MRDSNSVWTHKRLPGNAKETLPLTELRVRTIVLIPFRNDSCVSKSSKNLKKKTTTYASTFTNRFELRFALSGFLCLIHICFMSLLHFIVKFLYSWFSNQLRSIKMILEETNTGLVCGRDFAKFMFVHTNLNLVFQNLKLLGVKICPSLSEVLS